MSPTTFDIILLALRALILTLIPTALALMAVWDVFSDDKEDN